MIVAPDEQILVLGYLLQCCLVMNFPYKQHNAVGNKRKLGDSVIANSK